MISDEEIAAMFEHGDKDGSRYAGCRRVSRACRESPSCSGTRTMQAWRAAAVCALKRKLKMLFSAVLSPTARGRAKGLLSRRADEAATGFCSI